jgi:hypothetical protein
VIGLRPDHVLNPGQDLNSVLCPPKKDITPANGHYSRSTPALELLFFGAILHDYLCNAQTTGYLTSQRWFSSSISTRPR